MITGRITSAHEATISLPVEGLDHRVETIEFTIDTGFTGFIGLPGSWIARLGLPFLGFKQVTLGDGSSTMLAMFAGLVHWHERMLRVPALEVDGGALVGMRLLHGSRLTMDILKDGSVSVEPIIRQSGR